ncbi:MAG: hypothetical protein K6E18_03605 [Lachnospiraceae bacterium]|nr:hypothetical protein [Lachnospiraceae bacterium]
MKRKMLQSAAAIVLSASLLFEVAVPVSAAQTTPDVAIDAVEEELAVETVSGNESKPAPTVGVPGNVTASVFDEKTIKVSWSAVNGASGYEVYSSTNGKAFTKLWSFDGNVTSMDVLATLDQKALNIASSYSFKVKAFIKDGDKVYYSEESAASAAVKPARAEADWLLSSKAHDYKSVDLSWRPAGGVSGYKIFIATKKDGAYKQVATATEPGILIAKDADGRDLSLAKKYYFKVQAYVSDGGTEYDSTTSAVVEAKTELKKPEIDYLSANASDFVTVKWTKVKGADGYEVYRSKNKKKPGTVIAGGKKKKGLNKITKLKKRKFIDREAIPGQKYWYRVRAYKIIKGRRYYSEFDLWPRAAATTLASTSFVADGCVCEKPNFVKLTWKSVKNAKGYFVQRSTNQTSGFTTVATIDGGNSTVAEIAQDNGTKYYYQIVGFNNKSKKKTWSYPSDPVLMTSNYYCYPSETYQERCRRVFGQDYYHAYGTQAEADSRMEVVGFEKWSVDPKKKTSGYTVKKLENFKVNKKVQPTVQQIINEVQAAQIQGVNLKIEAASGYDFASSYQEDREGVTVKVQVTGGTPGTEAYTIVSNIMAKYGFTKVTSYNQNYDPYRYVYVGLH